MGLLKGPNGDGLFSGAGRGGTHANPRAHAQCWGKQSWLAGQFGVRGNEGEKEVWEAVQRANALLEHRREGPEQWKRCCYNADNETQCGAWLEGGNPWPGEEVL